MPDRSSLPGAVQVVEVADAPFCRSDLRAVLDGPKFAQARRYPIRGEGDPPVGRGSDWRFETRAIRARNFNHAP